jgi:hypothetical protein
MTSSNVFNFDSNFPDFHQSCQASIDALIAAIATMPDGWVLTSCIGKKNFWLAWQKTKLDRAQLIVLS